MRSLEAVLARLDLLCRAPERLRPVDGDALDGCDRGITQAATARALLQALAAAAVRDFEPPWQVAVVPELAALSGGVLRLLVDGESGNPAHWQQVGADRRLHPLGAPPDAVLRPGDLVLRTARSRSSENPASIAGAAMPWQRVTRASAADTTLDRVLDDLEAWSRQLRTEATQHARDPERRATVSATLRELATAREWLHACQMRAIERVASVWQVPSYAAGYYDMHVAIDPGSTDWQHWRVLDTSGQLRPLSEARGARQALDVFSGYVIARPARRD